MLNRNKFLMRTPFNRMQLLKYIAVVVLLDCVIGVLIAKFLSQNNIDIKFILITILFFSMVCLILLLPLLISNVQYCTLEEDGIVYFPKHSYLKKIKILLYVVVKNTMKPFLRIVSPKDMVAGELNFSDYVGEDGIICYIYHIKLKTKKRLISLYINPEENGVFISSDKDGLYFIGLKTKEDVLNILQYFEANNIPLKDKYMIVKALKTDNTDIYGYLRYCHQCVRL